jgi:uncharacterized membrane protein HdeD (DUF308 family)
MEAPMDAQRMDAQRMDAQRVQDSQAVAQVAQFWWLWLVVGIAWILAAVVVLQFRTASLTTVGLVIGIVFIVAGIQELFMAFVSEGWKWLWLAIGVVLVLAGLYALFNPVGTFLALADTLGFLFVLVGVFWMVEAFATAAVNPIWWLGMIAGIIMVGLGFWAGGQFLATKAYTLLIFAGIWMLLHGITDIVKGFQIRKAGALVAS